MDAVLNRGAESTPDWYTTPRSRFSRTLRGAFAYGSGSGGFRSCLASPPANLFHPSGTGEGCGFRALATRSRSVRELERHRVRVSRAPSGALSRMDRAPVAPLVPRFTTG